MVGRQESLFETDADVPGADVGYRGTTACTAAGISYRQLDYWARTELVEPSVRSAQGSGTQRLYSFRDILLLRIVKTLLDSGVSLQNIRRAVAYLRDHGTAELSAITLMSDGTSIYECTSTDEIVDVLRGGQAVFAVAVAPVVRELGSTLAQLPSERPTAALGATAAEAGSGGVASDELAARRRRRTSA